jgi:hypothetical protein
MNCKICGKPIQLVPSAQERAEKAKQRNEVPPYTSPSYYTQLFTTHAECFIAERQRQTIAFLNARKET